MRTTLVLFALFLLIQTSYSQEDSIYQINRFGSAAFTEIATNPAFTGLEGRHVLDLSYDLMHFGDWNFDQFKVDYSTTFGRKNQLGIGGYYFCDKAVYSKDHEFNASVAYKFIIKKKLEINTGLSVLTYHRMVVNLEKLGNGAVDPNDPLLQGSKYIEDRLDYNMGLWLNYQRFYFGFSCLDFFTVDLQGDDTEFFDRSASTHINTGYDLSLAKDWHVSPTIYVLNIFEENDLYQFGLFADYSNIVFAGITYKMIDGAASDFMGVRSGALIAKRIRVTLGYEFATDEEETFGQDFSKWILGLRLQY